MEDKYLILVDEQLQRSTIEKIKNLLKSEGINLIYEYINPNAAEFQQRTAGKISINKEKIVHKITNISYFKYSDTIACDYNLVPPDINGFDIICELRKHGYKTSKQIILYSAGIDTVISEILFDNTSERERFKQILTSHKKIIKTNIDKNIDKILDKVEFNLSGNLNAQIKKLELITTSNINFVKREDYSEAVIKNMKKESEFSFENELSEWLHKRGNDTFNNSFPPYVGKKFSELAKEIEGKTHKSILFKKELVEQIISYLGKINGIE